MASSDRGCDGLSIGRRILVIGAPGAGKSTLARALGEALSVTVVHFDQLYWKPNWKARTAEDMPDIVAQAIVGEAWVFDGNNSRTLPLRAARADTLIWLDLPSPFASHASSHEACDFTDGFVRTWLPTVPSASTRRSYVGHGVLRNIRDPDRPNSSERVASHTSIG